MTSLWAEPQALLCVDCHAILDDGKGFRLGLLEEFCRTGTCLHYLCPVCRWLIASVGPVDCPACGSYSRSAAVSRMRQLYRKRRRYW